MRRHDLELILDALSAPGAAFILGAGASAPTIPTFAQLAKEIASHVDRLFSFPASTIPVSGLRDLMQPVIDQAKRTSDLKEWQAGAMTTATIAAILERIISRAHLISLPQYLVFSLISLTSSIVSFNWDGLAISRCPQRTILHPHGIVQPRLLSDVEFDDLLVDTQEINEPSARHCYLSGLVLPGEETSPALEPVREGVLALWMKAPSIVVVGYSFGLASHASYDEIWLDVFVEACMRNREAAVHIFAPDAITLRQALGERMKRTVNVFAWPLKWNVLSSSLLNASPACSLSLSALRADLDLMKSVVRQMSEQAERLT